jgi:hypothetical protein
MIDDDDDDMEAQEAELLQLMAQTILATVFNKIYDAIEGKDPFEQKTNKITKKILGIRPLVRLTAVMRMVSHGLAADAMDEHFQLSETVANQSLKKFAES